jgi:putative membrane protein
MAAPEGSAKGLVNSVEPELEVVAPVANNGTGFAPNFLPVSLWLGAVMTSFIFHLRRLPLVAAPASPVAQLLGKLGLLGAIVGCQALVVLMMSLFVLDIHVSRLLPYILTLLASSFTFLLIILALTRAFGDAGKAAGLILLIFQLSSAGGVLPVELSGGIFQELSPWLPFTWAVKAFRASMFGAYDGTWLQAWLYLVLAGALAGLSACFVGRWKFVTGDDHRPAMDI